MNKINEEKAKNICLIGHKNKTCRYVGAGIEGFECLKHTDLKEYLDKKAKAGNMVAQSDNCEGF